MGAPRADLRPYNIVVICLACRGGHVIHGPWDDRKINAFWRQHRRPLLAGWSVTVVGRAHAALVRLPVPPMVRDGR